MTRSRELAELATAYDTGTPLGMRNRIINGDMRIDQRNAGASITSAALAAANQAYFLDRWRQDATGQAAFTYQRNAGAVTPPAGFTNYLGCTSTAAYSPASNTTHTIRQAIEGFNVADLGFGTANAQPVTLSFWVRTSVAGTHSGSVTNTSRSFVFSFTVSAANTWEYKTVNVAGDVSGTWATDNSSGLIVGFNLGTGTGTFGGTATGWQAGNIVGLTSAVQVSATNGATFYITGVQLEGGSVATPFEHRPIGTELALCLRYAYKNTSGNYTGFVYNGVPMFTIPFPVVMRAIPTATAVTLLSPFSSTGAGQTNYTGATNIGVSNTEELARVNLTGGSWSSSTPNGTACMGASVLLFNAEL